MIFSVVGTHNWYYNVGFSHLLRILVSIRYRSLRMANLRILTIVYRICVGICVYI